MGRKSKLQLEAEKFSRTRNFKNIKEMLYSTDKDTVKLAIGIIESKGYKRVSSHLRNYLHYNDSSRPFSGTAFDLEPLFWQKYLHKDIEYNTICRHTGAPLIDITKFLDNDI